jgi:hypothetical protein
MNSKLCVRMIRYILPVLLLATPAIAQQAPPQPSQQALIATLHSQLMQESDALTLSEARYTDAGQQTAALQAAAQKAAPTVKRK